MPDEAADSIEERLARLEAQVATMARALGMYKVDRQNLPQLRAPGIPPPAEPVPQSAAQSKPQYEPAPAKRPMDFESLFGGRVLLGVGALILLLGIGFFIKYAFDNGWIGPTGRVAMGLIAGVAFVLAGRRFATGERKTFADAMTGLGGAILYLSLWGAGNGFHLVPLAASFGAMALVTAALILLAVRGDSEVTAAFAVLGGFVTPLLNASDTPAYLTLFGYVALLDSALAFLPVNRRWPRIQAASFLCTQLYFFASIIVPGEARGPSLTVALPFATLYLALFLAQPLRKASRGVALSTYEAGFVVSASAAFYYALHVELYAAHRHWLTAAVVALAAAYLGLAQLARSRDRDVFASLALALITGGVAITFTGSVVPILWSIEGALLIWVGLRQRRLPIRIFGCIALALGSLGAFSLPSPIYAPPPPFFNERFLTLAILAAAYFSVRYAWLRAPDKANVPENALYLAAEPAALSIALVAISLELVRSSHANALTLTIFWLIYAACLFTFGFVRNYALARWEAFALLTLAILKVLVVDMSEVNPGVRIVSFVTLGCVLLAVSYASQRFGRPPAPDAAPAERT